MEKTHPEHTVRQRKVAHHHLVTNSGLTGAQERTYISFHRSISPADSPCHTTCFSLSPPGSVRVTPTPPPV